MLGAARAAAGSFSGPPLGTQYMLTTGTSWTPPFTGRVSVECIGSGGTNGGRGGDYSLKNSFVVIKGSAVTYQIGITSSPADTWFGNASTVFAMGGNSDNVSSGSPEPSTSIGDVIFSGGDAAGSGGGAGGPHGNGGVATSTVGGNGDNNFGGAGGLTETSPGGAGSEWTLNGVSYGSGGGGGFFGAGGHAPGYGGGLYGGGGGGDSGPGAQGLIRLVRIG